MQYMPNPSASLPCNEVERRYFRLFQEKLAFDLCGQFETVFWTRLIPQECYHEPAVRHAILALSALYKSAESRIYTIRTNDEHLNFALVEYSKAIISLRKILSDGRPHVRLALMASVLFGAFESFHGNWETALQQIYSGLNILKYLQEDGRRKAKQSLATVDPELGLTLRCLKLQIFSFLAMSPMCEHPITDSTDEEVIEDIPDRFATIHEAVTWAISLAIVVFQYLRRSARCRDIGAYRDSLAQERDSLNRLLGRWSKANGPIFIEACRNRAYSEYLAALQLRTVSWGSKL
jgi:hypothetical protein